MRVALIIASRNNAQFLIQSIDSAIHQTKPYNEIIVVDDASEDNSLRIAEGKAAQNASVKVVALNKRMGVARARDIGIRASNATHISTLDADDFLLSPRKNELESQIIEEAAYAPAVIAFSNIHRVSVNGVKIESVAETQRIREGHIFWPILYINCLVPRDFLFSKDAYFQAGGYDPSFTLYEDWDLKLRLARSCRFIYTKIDGVAYRQTPTGLSQAPAHAHLSAMRNVIIKNTQSLSPPHRLTARLLAYTRILWLQRGRIKATLLHHPS